MANNQSINRSIDHSINRSFASPARGRRIPDQPTGGPKAEVGERACGASEWRELARWNCVVWVTTCDFVLTLRAADDFDLLTD